MHHIWRMEMHTYLWQHISVVSIQIQVHLLNYSTELLTAFSLPFTKEDCGIQSVAPEGAKKVDPACRIFITHKGLCPYSVFFSGWKEFGSSGMKRLCGERGKKCYINRGLTTSRVIKAKTLGFSVSVMIVSLWQRRDRFSCSLVLKDLSLNLGSQSIAGLLLCLDVL